MLHTHRPYRSLFWPVIFIGIGILWLLSSLGAIAELRLPVLVRLWPLLFIFTGLDLLIGRRSALLGAVLGGAVVLIAVGFTLGGRILGLSPDVQPKTEHLSEDIGEARTANVWIIFSDSPVSIAPQSIPGKLFDAQLTYVGTIHFFTSGDEKKTVRLARDEADFLLFNPLYWDPSLNWQIGLTTLIPIDLSLNGSSGSSQVDLSTLQLSRVKVVMGSGSAHIIAPASGNEVPVEADGGSGEMDWVLPGGASLKMQINGGSGLIAISLSAQPAVHLEDLEAGSGKLIVPTDWLKVSIPGKQGSAWESPGYAQASRKVDITITRMGSGDIRISPQP